MKIVVQRVQRTVLKVDGKTVSEIPFGLTVFLGVKSGDSEANADYLMKKVAGLRIFEDENGKMNRSVQDVGGEVLLVSQFTLYGDAKKGFRPSFSQAEEPVRANQLYEYAAQKLVEHGVVVKLGVFGADMKIEQYNDGPVTIIIDTDDK